MESKIKFFVVFHKELVKEYYNKDIIDKYSFINVSPTNKIELPPAFSVFNQFEFENFYPIGKIYTESEVLYNVYKNKYLTEGIEYIGFLQYDIDSTSIDRFSLESWINSYQHINFQPYIFDSDYNQKILMDDNQPQKRRGNGVNCYDVIIADYNKYYKTNFNVQDLKGKTINLCSSFLLKKELFVEMMEFVTPIIESRRLEDFDTQHKYRIQGGLLERYYAVWIAFQNLNDFVFKLEHFFAESTVQDSILNKLIKKAKNIFRQ